ncbi:MAG: hypothetical protein KY428_10415 [Bacteroidetes bacterium]|nr:hypothetical protein [Bacteroidota bacterium]
MIHIATVHWQNDQWIDIQLQYLKKNISAPFKVYAFLNEISQAHYNKFFYVCDEPIEEHAIKLNLLAQIILRQAQDEDILLFLDGDAFPIAPLDQYLTTYLSYKPLLAIVRKENFGDIQPHPSFCATTASLWKMISGDWKKGYCWQDQTGQLITDVGGNLLKKLVEHNISWQAIYRSKSVDNHPIWYGIYGNLIYHHGGGFRPPIERIDFMNNIWLRLLWLTTSKSRSLNFLLERFLEKSLHNHISKRRIEKHEDIFLKILNNQLFFDSEE